MSYDYSKLRGRIIQKFGTYDAFANAASMSGTSLSYKLRGKVGISQHDMTTWAELLQIPLEQYGEFFMSKAEE